MSAVSRFRDRERRQFEQRHGVKLTYLPFVARAVCEALHRLPTLNASWSEEGVVLKRDIHLGIAVALEDNLVVPVVRNADRLSITGLATTMADLGERARANRLKLDEIQGGTFTLNNTGALGAVMTQAIINQPQAAIMTMDLVVKRPVVVGDDAELRAALCEVREVNWIPFATLDKPVRATVKIRHRHEPASATLVPTDPTSARVEFDMPQRAITPGQAAVFYSGELVLGGGWIR